MKTRRAQLKDIPRIMHLLRQVCLVHHNGRPDLFKVATKYTEDELAEIIANDNTPIFVAVDDDDVAWGHGFCMIEEYKDHQLIPDRHSIYIDDICVDEAARRQHIGQDLYHAICEYAKEIGCYNITLNVWELNDGARKFYESFGMRIQKTTLETIL